MVDIQWYEPYAATNEYHPFADVVMDEYGRLLPAVNRFPSAATVRALDHWQNMSILLD